jgi:hopene-associated glycosyltransferase HpnB
MLAVWVVGALSLAAWAGVLLRPGRPWLPGPYSEERDAPPPAGEPSVAVVVPARNEADHLPRTLPPLVAQGYPVLVVDDRSSDGTAAVASRLGARVVHGQSLPDGWAGKVWALDQGVRAAGAVDYLLLTDADILHAAGTIRRLVAEAEADGLALNSRLARLHCRSVWERLLIPPFVFFFNVLYPMRRANAAAGGCMLVRRESLERAGGLAAIRGAVIDDVNLAQALARTGGRLRLALSQSDLVSVRAHESAAELWRMVSRTAFAQLGRSYLLLAATVGVLAVAFVAPPVLLAFPPAGAALGAAAWLLQAALVLPTARYFRLNPLWALTLPLAGVLYGAMTVDSALRPQRDWRAAS